MTWDTFEIHIQYKVMHCFYGDFTYRMLDISETDNSAGGARKSGVAAAAPEFSSFMLHTFANVTLLLHNGTLHDFKVGFLHTIDAAAMIQNIIWTMVFLDWLNFSMRRIYMRRRPKVLDVYK